MKRNRIIFLTIIVIVIFLTFNPFKSGSRIARPYVEGNTVKDLSSYLQENYRDPGRYVVSLFESRQIVFLGEFQKIRDHAVFAAELIPSLYRSGVTNMGIEYALYRDQEKIDRLITSSTYSEEDARAIIFNWVVLWGVQEYLDLFKAAWEFNRTLPAGSRPFRIVGLNMKYAWEHIASEEDLKNPEVLRKVFTEGIPDVYMANVIRTEFIEKDRKALVYAGFQRSFTRYRSLEYAKNMNDQGFEDGRRAGNIIYDQIGDRAATVLIHAPWADKNAQIGIAHPVGGAIDTAIDRLPRDRRRAGFDTAGTPFGDIAVTATSYTFGYDKLTLGDICDGYVVPAPLSKFKAATPIADFITDANFDAAVANFPGPKPDMTLTPARMNQFIAQDIEGIERILKQFR